MKRVVYSVAMSLDGYIAGPNGESDWILMDPDIDFGELARRFDVALMGRRTFEATAAHGGGPMPGLEPIVVSRSLRREHHPDLTILDGSLEEEIPRLRAEPGKDIWLFGGGELFRTLLDLDLVDEVEVAVIPILLGDGRRLLPAPGDRAELRLTGSRVYETTGTVVLRYEVVKG